MAPPKKADAGDTRRVHLPRTWLIGALTLLTVPWLIAGALYFRSAADHTDTPAATPAVAQATAVKVGPWGRLSVTPIVVSPPLEYVAADWNRSDEAYRWYLPGMSPDEAQAFFTSTGMTGEQVSRLMAGATADPRIRGVSIRPDLAVVKGLDSDARARLYLQLARTQLNSDQNNSFRFFGTPDAWLAGSLISPRTRQLVEPLIYRDGDVLHFADAELVRAEVADADERQRLAKTLLRQSTMLVRLAVTEDAEIPALTQYWGRGGRSTDIRPLLESVAGAGADGWIDIVHLLPSFARNRLYRYPKLTTADLNKSVLVNCLWSSLNFFRTEPDDRFLELNAALAALRQDYYIVEHGYQLGDIIGFLDAEGDLYHVAVYLADDLVFTKNGMSPVSSWTIMPLQRVKDYYRLMSRDPRLIYHRRNDF